VFGLISEFYNSTHATGQESLLAFWPLPDAGVFESPWLQSGERVSGLPVLFLNGAASMIGVMAKLNQQSIRALAKQIIASNPGGIRYTPLTKAIAAANPETPENTIHGSIWNLDTIFPNEIIKPSRGLFQSVSAAEADNQSEVKQVIETPTGKIREQDFYDSFAEFLKADLDEVNHAAALGGAGLKGKWGDA
jgi:hypothetical protein